MSLVAYSSPWTNNEPSPKKRSTMRRQRMQPTHSNDDQINNEYNVSQIRPNEGSNNEIPTIEDMQNVNNDKTSRVNDLLNKMTSVSHTEENDTMGEFNPMNPPEINVKKDMISAETNREYVGTNSSYVTSANSLKTAMDNEESYKANNNAKSQYGNYNNSYNGGSISNNRPYYANMGIGSTNTGAGGLDNKMMEKINYLIHLLEEQQHEKTNNITEEFLLYTFLGVFVIYVIDSFARTGKYIR